MSHFEPDDIERATIADKEAQDEIRDTHTFTLELSSKDVSLLIATNVVSREEAHSTHSIGQAVADFIHTDVMESVSNYVNMCKEEDLDPTDIFSYPLSEYRDYFRHDIGNPSKISVVFDVMLSDKEIGLLQEGAIISGERPSEINEIVRPNDSNAKSLNFYIHSYIKNVCRDVIENIKSGYGNENDFKSSDFMKVYLINDKSSDTIKDYLSSNFHYSEWAEDNKSFSVFVDDLDSTLSMMDRRGINYHLEGGHFKDIIRPTSFINDKEKMRDFKELSKEEFLQSYSYLTEEEYDLTVKEVAAKQEKQRD